MYALPLFGFLLLSAGMQASTDGLKPSAIPACSQVRCRGKRVEHFFGAFAFCIPHHARFRRVNGFEGDIHDLVTIRVHGELSELIMFTANVTWGPAKPRPDDWPAAVPADTVSVKAWQCPEGDGQDFRFRRGNRNWRMLSFPMGFAEYKNVESGVADQFDRVLDSFCCKAVN